jgi:hypothetical protein
VGIVVIGLVIGLVVAVVLAIVIDDGGGPADDVEEAMPAGRRAPQRSGRP